MPTFPKQLLENPSGFPDLSPAEAIKLNWMLDVIRKHFERTGFVPLETPLVERPEVLTAKAEGEIATQVYGLRLLNPAEGASDEKDLALRYDHTVPLARYIASHSRELAFPFRRYAIGPVLRGERSKDGRYRQFIQADIDTVGDAFLSLPHDAEMAAVIRDIFDELAIGPFTIRISNRKVLAGLVRGAGLTNETNTAKALRIIDRLEKTGAEETLTALSALGMDESRARQLLDALLVSHTTDDALTFLKGQVIDDAYAEGVKELAEVVTAIRAYSVPEKSFTVDLTVARGLDYYTGTVYETRLDEHVDLGSIASGGRYDNLAGAFIDHDFPGVGISIGVTRLLLRLIKTGVIKANIGTVAPVLVTTATGLNPKYFGYARAIREAGIDVELYLATRPLDKQLHYANRRGFKIALIAQEEQLEKSVVIVRNLVSGGQQEVSAAELVHTVRTMFGV